MRGIFWPSAKVMTTRTRPDAGSLARRASTLGTWRGATGRSPAFPAPLGESETFPWTVDSDCLEAAPPASAPSWTTTPALLADWPVAAPGAAATTAAMPATATANVRAGQGARVRRVALRSACWDIGTSFPAVLAAAALQDMTSPRALSEPD